MLSERRTKIYYQCAAEGGIEVMGRASPSYEGGLVGEVFAKLAKNERT